MIRSLGCQFGSRLPQNLQPPGQSWPTTECPPGKTQRLWPVASGVVKTEKTGNAMPAPIQLDRQVIRGWCRRTSSPGKGSRRRGRARWGGPRVCGRRNTPSGLQPLWKPAMLRQWKRTRIGVEKSLWRLHRNSMNWRRMAMDHIDVSFTRLCLLTRVSNYVWDVFGTMKTSRTLLQRTVFYVLYYLAFISVVSEVVSGFLIYNLSRDLTVPIWLGTFAVSFSLHLLLPVAI